MTWVSHVDRSTWSPELLAEVEAAEARMIAAVAASRAAAVAALATTADYRDRPAPDDRGCGHDATVLYGPQPRCFDCWVADPGYDRPDTDPLMVALRDVVRARTLRILGRDDLAEPIESALTEQGRCPHCGRATAALWGLTSRDRTHHCERNQP
jgi:hypothetical protein